MNRPMQAYQNVNLGASVQTASPHQLITMLLQGCLEALAKAQGAIERGDIGKRSEQLNKAIAIIMELKGSLDLEKGGDISANLDGLYAYMTRLLIEANRANKAESVAEVTKLLTEVLEGWADIPPEHRHQQD